MVYLPDIYGFAGIYQRFLYFFVLLRDYMTNQFKKNPSEITFSKVF